MSPLRSRRLWTLGLAVVLNFSPASLAGGNPFLEQPTTLHEGKAEVLCLAYSPDGSLFAAGDADKTVRIWSTFAGRLKHTLIGHKDVVAGLAFSPDGRTLATASHDRTVKLWDAETGKEKHTLTGHENWVFSVAFAPTGKTLATASYDKSIKLWDLTTGKELFTVLGHEAGVRSIAFSTDGKTLYSGGGDRVVKIWDLEKREERRSLTGHSGAIRAVAVSSDGKTLATAGEDKTVKLWNPADGTLISTLDGHSEIVASLAFSPVGSLLASAGFDGQIILWDAQKRTRITALTEHADGVTAVAFSPSGRQLASGSSDKTIRLWNAPVLRIQPKQSYKGYGNLVTFGQNAYEAKSLAATTDGRSIIVADWTTGITKVTLRGHNSSVLELCMSNDGKLLAAAARDKTVRLWETATGKSLGVLTGQTGIVRALAFSPAPPLAPSLKREDGGVLLATAGDARIVHLWSTAQLNQLAPLPRHSLRGHEGAVACVAFSPDGRLLASSGMAASRGSTGQLKLWDASTGTLLASFNPEPTATREPAETVAVGSGLNTALTFSPDGKRLASAGDNGVLSLWDVSSHRLLVSRKMKHVVRSVAFSPDGRAMITGHSDGSLIVWETTTWQERARLMGHQAEIQGIAISADGKSAVTASKDQTIKAWDLEAVPPAPTTAP